MVCGSVVKFLHVPTPIDLQEDGSAHALDICTGDSRGLKRPAEPGTDGGDRPKNRGDNLVMMDPSDDNIRQPEHGE